jgi:hypothetical protein
MKKFIKDLYNEYGMLSIVFGITATVWLSPLFLVFFIMKYVVELPIKYLFKKIKTNRPFKK